MLRCFCSLSVIKVPSATSFPSSVFVPVFYMAGDFVGRPFILPCGNPSIQIKPLFCWSVQLKLKRRFALVVDSCNDRYGNIFSCGVRLGLPLFYPCILQLLNPQLDSFCASHVCVCAGAGVVSGAGVCCARSNGQYR